VDNGEEKVLIPDSSQFCIILGLVAQRRNSADRDGGKRRMIRKLGRYRQGRKKNYYLNLSQFTDHLRGIVPEACGFMARVEINWCCI
jgi:hypothetical protein